MSLRPVHWELDQQFDPFYVRSHVHSIANGLTQSVKAGKYTPRPALRREFRSPTVAFVSSTFLRLSTPLSLTGFSARSSSEIYHT